MPASTTYKMQDLLDRARIPLNDAKLDPLGNALTPRYADTELLGYANDAVLLLRKRRPDLFLGQWATLPINLGLTAYFPVPDEYFPVISDYVTARAEIKDDEFNDNQRSTNLLALVEKGLLSI